MKRVVYFVLNVLFVGFMHTPKTEPTLFNYTYSLGKANSVMIGAEFNLP